METTQSASILMRTIKDEMVRMFSLIDPQRQKCETMATAFLQSPSPSILFARQEVVSEARPFT